MEILDRYNFSNFKLSLKASNIQMTVDSYRKFSKLLDQPLHLGITESGSYRAGSVKSSIGLGMLLSEGIGDTIRVSLASDPVDEVKIGWDILKSNKEIFRVANALNPGTFEENTKTFAVIMATDLNNVEEPLLAVREMVAFAYNFSEKFYANICDGERLPITKQMISHIETKAQEVTRLRQLKNFD